jgi:D-glycero-D-manno-heptose 1,7-bisphosphate phosphatase
MVIGTPSRFGRGQGGRLAKVKPIAAVFLDRDGILNEYLPGAYVRTPGELRVIPGVAAAVRRLNNAAVSVIVVSNQQGVGKGLMTAGDLEQVQHALCRCLNEEAGARVDRFYYCTDLAGASTNRRKPAPGMLIEAASDFGFAVSDAVMIGDSGTDIGAGDAAGVSATILVLSGAIREYVAGTMSPAPDHVFRDLASAVDWILKKDLPSL